MRQPVGFERVTLDARTDDILPSRFTTAIPRNHVIEVKVLTLKYLPAVLALILISIEYVVAGQLNFPAR